MPEPRVPSARPACDDDRWTSLWAHRETLLRLARARLPNAADAEDVVSEAMLRAASDPKVELATAGAWMNRVVTNLCVDRYREASYDRHRVRFAIRHATPVASPEDEVCDRAEATAVRRRVLTLPDRQRQAVLLRAAGHDVSSIARELDADYKAVESLLSRARRSLRTTAMASFAASVAVFRRTGRGARASVPSAAVVSAAVVSVAFVVAAPDRAPSAGAAGRPPAARAAAPAPREALARAGGSGPARVAAPAPRRTARDTARPGGGLIVAKQRVDAPGVRGETPGVRRTHEDESFLASVERCLREGIVVSPDYVGCRSARS